MPKAVGWKHIPDELKQYRQWCVSNYAHPDIAERKAPRIPIHGAPRASVTDASTWRTFDEAAQYAWDNGPEAWCIGFVLTAKDPYCVVDLDVKDQQTHPNKPEVWTTQEEMNHYWRVAQDANTYVERSIGGKSLHIIVKANIGPGARARGIEIYSQERYIICTGNVVIDKPVREAQQMMEKSVANLRQLSTDKPAAQLYEEDPEYTDEEIFEMAMNASNGAKFDELCKGNWQQFGYPSHSEADLALMSIFTFYSKSNEQCRRLFRATVLGQRDKAQRDNKFLDRTLSLVRGRQERERAMDYSALQKSVELLERLNGKAPTDLIAPLVPDKLLPATPTSAPVAAPIAALATQTDMLQKLLEKAAKENGSDKATLKPIDWPPGMIGALAKYIYGTAPRPIKEVAIVAAFGFMAGVCGKSFVLPQSGLNIYFILVALSAIGKEALHSGIACILEELRERNPVAMNFVDFSAFASGPALIKACMAQPSFVNVNGEWGRTLKRMAEDSHGRDSAMGSLRTTMTNLYQKSGPTSIVGGISYSQKENNVGSMTGVAYSMIGETTPKTYYESLTESMMEDGFLSRFTMLEYNGLRPPTNPNIIRTMDKSFGDYLGRLCTYSLSKMTGLNSTVEVQLSPSAKQFMDNFDIECDREINSRYDEAWRQMWNRAHLKALRFAALMAVGDNYLEPIIQIEHAQWAVELIRRDIHMMSRRLRSGDVGLNDDSRDRKLMSLLEQYLISEEAAESYGIPENLRRAGIIQRKYLQIRCARITAFYKNRLGATVALDQAIKTAIDNGYLVEVPRDQLAREYGFHGKCYRIIDL